MADARTLSGSLVFRDPVPPGGGTVRIVLEDTSRADARATVVAEAIQVLPGPIPAGQRRAFSLVVPQVDDAARYGLRAHMNRSGSGELSGGDFITVQAYPVLTHGATDRVDLELVQI
jgi:putative lipoprotein